MIRVDSSQFANVITSVQRTGSLTGGAVRGLPNGVVVDGISGVQSFGSAIAEAQKEFDRGRVHLALERVKQIETQFNGLAGRWNSVVGSILSSARQGNQNVPLQKLNEVKTAQTKMQQLIGPATKAFRDLVSALEHAVANHRENDVDEQASHDQAADGQDADDQTTDGRGSYGQGSHDQVPDDQQFNEANDRPNNVDQETVSSNNISDDKIAHPEWLGDFAADYDVGPKLQWEKGEDKKVRLKPQLEKGHYYLMAGFKTPCVVCLRDVQRQSIVVSDPQSDQTLSVDPQQLRMLMRAGIWALAAKN